MTFQIFTHFRKYTEGLTNLEDNQVWISVYEVTSHKILVNIFILLMPWVLSELNITLLLSTI